MNSPVKLSTLKSPNLNDSDVVSISSDSKCGDDSPIVLNKPRKTYENKKHSTERISTCETNTLFTTPSPSENITSPTSLNNTSRYGRARKPKITEDFYNTEDIFGPYDRLPCSPLRSSPKKKTQTKLELSPTKSPALVTIDTEEIKFKSVDLTSVLSINIPEDSIEVSKVLKIVTNNSPGEFSPKSPTIFAKPVKTYTKRHKKSTDSVFESFGLPDPAPYLVNSMAEDPLAIADSGNKNIAPKQEEHKLVLKEGPDNTLLEDPLYIGDQTIFPAEIPKPSIRTFIITDMSVVDNAPKIMVEKLSDDNLTSPKTSPTVLKINKENSKKQFKKLKQQKKFPPKRGSSSASTSTLNGKKKLEKNGKKFKKKKFGYKIVERKTDTNLGNKKKHENIIIPVSSDVVENEISVTTKLAKPTETITLLDLNSSIFRPTVGSICWSRVGTFPFWPSIVSNEPDTDLYHKAVSRGRGVLEHYHVNFFGDNGRRSWVVVTHIFPFTAKTDLEQMAKSVSKEAKPKDPRHISAFIIPSTKLAKWETAVSEAESITKYLQEKRMKQFFEMVVTKRKQKRSFDSIRSPNSDKPSKKKKLEEGISPEKLKNKLEKLTAAKIDLADIKKGEKELPPRAVKGKTRKSDVSVEGVMESRRKSLRNIEIFKSNQVSDESDSELDIPGRRSITRSGKNDARNSPSPVPSLSSVPKKKVNLFKGVTREKVCQLCGGAKNVFKCKGTCFGFYHIECDKQQQYKLKIKVEAEEETKEETITDKDAGKTIEEIIGEVLEEMLCATAKSVQNPTEKTPSLSLAEKIDLKMQEVMHNILSEATKYSENTDSCSESDDCCEVISQENTLPSIIVDDTKTLTETNQKKTYKAKKLIKHVTADGVLVIEDDDGDEEDDKPQEELTMSKEDLENYKCTFCATNTSPPCFICNEETTASGDSFKHKCMTPQCGRFYHGECLKEWPQTKWYLSTKSKNINNEEDLSCPYHNCHTCISDDPRAPLAHQSNEKLTKCIRCPTTYHINSYCVPAGSQILTAYQIICPKHLGEDENKKYNKMKLMHHVNTSWCFICSMGGSLICCETCPSSFHVECLKLTPPEGRYICEECESGRLPLYDEVVWVKLGSYRWWPAQILFPSLIPEKVCTMQHHKGEFVVRFFGSHDHYWVNRGRVFLFQEGDTGHSSSKKNAVDWLFIKAIKEATVAHKQFMDARQNRVADYHTSMKPPSYVKIKVNKPVGAIKSVDADTSNTTPCDCDPKMDNPCGPDSDCLNRILLTECQPMVCAAGSRCCNQAFQNRCYTPVKPFKTAGKGWGLKTLAPLKKGTFVIEYVGEVINESEYKRRMKRKHEQKDENYYFLTIEKDRMIDAGPKGNVARFMNHSCSPNCETQKWTVNGDTKVGLFAIMEIAQGTELTFNYNLECIGEEKKECRCGAPNCSGFIGVKAKQDELNKKRKSYNKVKKKKTIPEEVKQSFNCFNCGGPDAEQSCDREACNKVYHASCVDLENYQEGKWFCPWHSCNICTKRTIRSCYMCTNSFCPLHSDKNIRYDRIKGFICKEHDLRELDPSATNNFESTNKDPKTKERSSRAKSRLSRVEDADADDEGNKKKNSGRISKASNRNSQSSRISSPVLDISVKRPNGAYNVFKDELEKGSVRNQNNNLAIKKRKSRLSLKKSDDEEDLDDVPLEKRLRKSISQSQMNEDFSDIDDSPLLLRMKENLDIEKEEKEEEINCLQLDDITLLNRLKMQLTNVEMTDDHEEEITTSLCDDDTPILDRLRRINSITDEDNIDDPEICNAFISSSIVAEFGSLDRPRSRFRRFTRSLSRTGYVSSPILTIDLSPQSDSELRRSRRDQKTPTRSRRRKRSLSLSYFKHVEEVKIDEEFKELKQNAKKPLGRPKKSSKSPKKTQASEKVNETPSAEENTIETTEETVEETPKPKDVPKEPENIVHSTDVVTVAENLMEEVYSMATSPTEQIEKSVDEKLPEVLPECTEEKDVIEINKLVISSKVEEVDKSSPEDKIEYKIKTTIDETKTDTNIEKIDDLPCIESKKDESISGTEDIIPEYSHLVTISDNSSEEKFNTLIEAKENDAKPSDETDKVDKVEIVSETPKKRFTRHTLNLIANEISSELSTKPEDTTTKNSVITPECSESTEDESYLKSQIKSPKKRYTRYTLSLLTNHEESSNSVDSVSDAKNLVPSSKNQTNEKLAFKKCPKKRFKRYNFNITNHVDSSNSNSVDMTEDVNNMIKDFNSEEGAVTKKLYGAPIQNMIEILKKVDTETKTDDTSSDHQDKNENVSNIEQTESESNTSQIETEDDSLNSSSNSKKKPFKKFNLSLRKTSSSKEISTPRISTRSKDVSTTKTSSNSKEIAIPKRSSSSKPSNTSKESSIPKLSNMSKESSIPKLFNSSKESSVPKLSNISKESSIPNLSSSSNEISTPKLPSSSKEVVTPKLSNTSKESSIPKLSNTSKESSIPKLSNSSKESSIPKLSISSNEVSTPKLPSSSKEVVTSKLSNTSKEVVTPKLSSSKEMLAPELSSSSKEISAPELTSSSKEISTPKLLTTNRMKKLLNPTPGIRKSSRYSLPDTTTENIITKVSETDSVKDNSALEDKTLNSMKNATSTIENDYSKPIPLKKKVLTPGVRKSARFSKSNTDDTNISSIIASTSTDLPKDDKTEDITESSDIFKRKRSRFCRPTDTPAKKPIVDKFKKLVTPTESQSEMYKMKLNHDSRIKPFENHVNEVKLTANVPERHLRVILRKTDIESRSDSKFIKMQNDIEKNLPIRKRSKLRYENQLPE